MWLDSVIGFDTLFGLSKLASDNAWPIRNFNRILWVSGLMVLYIGLNHNAERLIRNIEKTKTDVDELRTQYTTQQAEFMRSSKQSEITQHVVADSLIDSQRAPYKIVVKRTEFE